MTWGMQLLGKWRGKTGDDEKGEMSLAKAKDCVWEFAKHLEEQTWGFCVSVSSKLKEIAPSGKAGKTSLKTPREHHRTKGCMCLEGKLCLPLTSVVGSLYFSLGDIVWLSDCTVGLGLRPPSSQPTCLPLGAFACPLVILNAQYLPYEEL